ncbi:PDGF_2 domain-containing protein [Caerostris extrusa]|nr:PDGF_2 domain-containing protein [Caerostris extrusa]
MDGNYKPHCVELYRCDKDAGCCKSDTEVCGPKEIEKVHLHISVTGFFETKILLMPFQNHTKCECQPLNDSPEISTDWR